MTRTHTALLAIAALLAAAPALAQQPSAAAQRGKAYAREHCAQCHVVEPGAPAPPGSQAPSFTGIAIVPGMTGMALSAWFVSSHPTMPNFIIPERNREDLIAYFGALKAMKAQAPKE